MDAFSLPQIVADPDYLSRLSDEQLLGLLEVLEGVKARIWIRLPRNPEKNREEGGPSAAPEHDQLLNVQEAADILRVTPRWLYDRSDDLPFARRLAPRTLRFSERELCRWIRDRE